MSSDIQWKIEDGELWVNSPVDGRDFWSHPNGFTAAAILQSAIAATQERCATVADAQVGVARRNREKSGGALTEEDDMWETGADFSASSIASAIRALKMETGHENS